MKHIIMKKTARKRSIAGEIIKINFVSLLTMTAIVGAVIFFAMCRSYSKNLYQETDDFLAEQKADIASDVETAIHKSDLIVKNSSVLHMLDEEFASVLDKMNFTNELQVYMDTLWDVDLDSSHQMLIYSANASLFEGQYIRSTERLAQLEAVKEKMSRENANMIWMDDISWSGDVPYLYFYRKIPAEHESFLEGCIRLNIRAKTPSVLRIEMQKMQKEEAAELSEGNAELRLLPVFDDWYLLVELSEVTIYKRYVGYFFVFLMFMMLMVVLIYFISQKSVKKVVQAVTDLLDRIRENTAAERNENPETFFWEFETVLQRIQSLIGQVEGLEKQYYENELLRRKVEIELLNYKLNPHILYNSLSAINLVAYQEDYGQVRNITNIMIDYYRDVLAKNGEIVTVEEEIASIGKFINISRISRNQDFLLLTDLEPSILCMPIPHLLFQPIVENAIMHGFNVPKPEMLITICGRQEGDFLVFRVQDNGKGMSEEQADKLNRLQSRGYGVKNTARRIQFYYGENCGLSFAAEKGKGTTATVKIRSKIFGLSMYSEEEEKMTAARGTKEL